ncbi:LysM peptidoglycan-binding domain-containing protein [Chitinivorax sp. B]|uniref:LysM peptidoglycan-binding domain-containing protein n=1 Tax=Chitinivorax sp. B TaxID=2502235 RepID=UPI001484E989|nr:LysM peptidoglycan-binding domain-containing protein [Chitinivorax sp. B]
MNTRTSSTYRPLAILVLTLLCAACVVPPPDESGPAVKSPVLTISPPEARAQAQRQALEARDLLQNGDEASARALLEHALQLDPTNEIARKLMEQIKADAQQELGAAHFAYVVQPGDTMAKLAERFLGDRLRFYILSKYNGLINPNRLAAGQIINVPGQAPKPAPVSRTTKPVEPAPAPAPVPETVVKPAEPPAPMPKPQAELVQQQAQRNALIQRYRKEAMAAFHRQDLDGSIRKWDQLLQLAPDDANAKYNRAKAVDLKAKLQKFPVK